MFVKRVSGSFPFFFPYFLFSFSLGSKGWRSGESACFPPTWAGFKSWRRRHMWVEFVVGLFIYLFIYKKTSNEGLKDVHLLEVSLFSD